MDLLLAQHRPHNRIEMLGISVYLARELFVPKTVNKKSKKNSNLRNKKNSLFSFLLAIY